MAWDWRDIVRASGMCDGKTLKEASYLWWQTETKSGAVWPQSLPLTNKT
jgi:hypothetical protein